MNAFEALYAGAPPGAMGLHLRQEPQPLHHSVVQINQFFLSHFVNIVFHSCTGYLQQLWPDVRNVPRATRTLLDLFFGIPNVALQVDWISRRAQTELDCVMALQHVSIENADLLLHEVSFIVSQPDIRLLRS